MSHAGRSAPVESLQCACACTGSILGKVSRDQLSLPTPCGDWHVSDLIDHIVGATDFFADVAERGSSPADRDWPSYSGGDFAASFAKHARRVLTAFAAPGAMERTMALPTGPSPGSACIQVATGEIFVHGWDLARATAQPMPPDQAVVAGWLLSSTWPSLCADVRNADGSVFAPEVAVPHDAPAADRLAAFLGRDPGWSPSG